MMPIVVLCGGTSTRLQPLTAKKPKSMVKVLGKPFIDHQLTLMQENDVKKVILCIGKFGDQIRDYVGNGKKWGMSVKYSDDGEQLLGTGGALKNAYDMLPEEFIVMNGDSYLDIYYNPIVQKFIESKKPLLMTVYPVLDGSYKNVHVRYGKIINYDKTGKNPDLNCIDYGFTPMKKWLLKHIPDGIFDFSVIYSNAIALKDAACYKSPKVFHEMGSYEGLEETTQYIKFRGKL